MGVEKGIQNEHEHEAARISDGRYGKKQKAKQRIRENKKRKEEEKEESRPWKNTQEAKKEPYKAKRKGMSKELEKTIKAYKRWKYVKSGRHLDDS